jgi:hypothetical protein
MLINIEFENYSNDILGRYDNNALIDEQTNCFKGPKNALS